MKTLPNINDDAAMLLRGKRSTLTGARLDAQETLRDACTALQGADWSEVQSAASRARNAAERLLTLSAMWCEVNA